MTESFDIQKLPVDWWELCVTEEGIFITRAAYEAAAQALTEEADINQYLRIGVRGGGCSGFMYSLEFTNEIDPEEDIVRELSGKYGPIKIVVDVFSAQYLRDCTIDYVKTLQESGFKFTNPKPGVRTCGCGSSFSG